MNNRVYTLFDRKMKEYGQLVLAKNDEVVRRMLKDGLKGSEHPAVAHPEDFDLVVLGWFNDETGVLSNEGEGHQPPQLVVNLKDLLEA